MIFPASPSRTDCPGLADAIIGKSVEEWLSPRKAAQSHGGRGYANKKQNQGQRGGGRLYVQDPAADGGGTVDTGNDDAEQEEYLDLDCKAGIAVKQSPGQTRGKKAVV
jgi:hypothetical protein